MLITSNLFSAVYSFKLEERVVMLSDKCDNWLVISNFNVGIVIAAFLILLKVLVQTIFLSIPNNLLARVKGVAIDKANQFIDVRVISR